MFTLNQRWISQTENELGLGIITEINHRTLTIFFPAANETRVYSRTEAPLIRVLLQKGDTAQHQEGWRAEVLEVMLNNDTALYLVKLQDGSERVINEAELAGQINFSKPQARLFNGQIDRNDRFELRYRALQHQQAQFQSPLRGLGGTRAALIPHQLHIAREVGQRLAPRVLLADEVGLGKTIEAGMILQQQILAGRADRVLIFVPENLQHQWLVEMLRRFNLHFSLFDEDRAADFDGNEEQAASNPFDSENRIICALNWLLEQPQRAAQLLASQFDLLIVDEAHHLAWSPQAASPAYQFVKKLAKHIPAVLLLTATPEQLGHASHFARLKLLDSDRFYDYQTFIEEQQHYQPVAQAVRTLLSPERLTAVQKTQISELLNGQTLTNLNHHDLDIRQSARQQIIAQLIDRHGTSRLLFRNTRQGIKGFPERHYHQILLPLPEPYLCAENRLQPQLQYANWTEFDPRLAWLAEFLQAHRAEKTLVICQSAQTAMQIEQGLREQQGIHSAVFHEKMSIIERDRAAAYFADSEQGAQVLLSSSIGSEGRNFQFARNLVLFDLPAHPDLLEQCIGRLDRIGQQQDVEIYVPCFENSAQALLADWYHKGLNAFEETSPEGAALYEKCGAMLQDFLQRPRFNEEFGELLAQTRQWRFALKQELEQGRDLLLEIHSRGGESAQQLAEQLAQADQDPALINFTLSLLDVIGIEQEELSPNALLITPSSDMLVPDFPGLNQDGTALTFDRSLALAREEMAFISWDHPLIRNGIDLILSQHIGKTAASLLINKNLPAGTLLVEAIYLIEVQADKRLNLNRFLPPTPVRLLLDIKGNDLSAQVSFEKLNSQLKPMNKNMANKMLKMVRPNIEKMLDFGNRIMAQKSVQLIEQAQAQTEQQLGDELMRLIELRALNNNVRAEEIQGQQQLLDRSLQALQQASWRLDSLRVMVSNQT